MSGFDYTQVRARTVSRAPAPQIAGFDYDSVRQRTTTQHDFNEKRQSHSSLNVNQRRSSIPPLERTTSIASFERESYISSVDRDTRLQKSYSSRLPKFIEDPIILKARQSIKTPQRPSITTQSPRVSIEHEPVLRKVPLSDNKNRNPKPTVVVERRRSSPHRKTPPRKKTPEHRNRKTQTPPRKKTPERRKTPRDNTKKDTGPPLKKKSDPEIKKVKIKTKSLRINNRRETLYLPTQSDKEDKDRIEYTPSIVQQLKMAESRPSIMQSDESRVYPISEIWDRIVFNYFSTYRGDEKIEKQKLLKALRHYDVLKKDRTVKTGKYIRYMKDCVIHPRLMPKCLVKECLTNKIRVYDEEEKKEKWVSRVDNIIFVNRKTKTVEIEKKKDNFRVLLEGFLKDK